MFDRKSKEPAGPTLLDRVVKAGSQRVAILGLHAQAGTRTVLASLVREIGARSSPLAHPLYLYLPEWPAVALPGWSIDPGRDMLCILTSPPRWLQWP